MKAKKFTIKIKPSNLTQEQKRQTLWQVLDVIFSAESGGGNRKLKTKQKTHEINH